MQYAAVIEVDNSREDPEAGRRGLREVLVPAAVVASVKVLAERSISDMWTVKSRNSIRGETSSHAPPNN